MPEQKVSFAAVGDIMLDNNVSKFIERKSPDFPFLNVASELENADIVFGNLETPLTTFKEKVIWDFSKYGLDGKAKPIFLKGSPLAAIGLKNGGFKVVSIANNHILDYGIRGLNETLTVLHKNGIMPVGFGRNTREATAPKSLEVKGVRFAFFACSFAYEATFFSPGVAPIALWTLKRQVKNAREIADIIVVSLHMGTEFAESPSLLTIGLAHSLIEFGADVVLCHHPHTLQKIETHKKGLIAYSLGNFIFDYDSFSKRARERTEENIEKCRQSIILKCTMSKNGLVDYSVIPVQLNDEFQPTVIPRNSKLSQRIIARVKAPLSPSGSYFNKKESMRLRKLMSEAVNGFALSFKRKDFKSLYILLGKALDRLYERAVVRQI